MQSNLVEQISLFTYNDYMLDTGPPVPFQVNGNYGVTAAIPEALVQSQESIKLGTNSSQAQPAYTGDLDKKHVLSVHILDPFAVFRPG